MSDLDLGRARRSYEQGALLEGSIAADPIAQLRGWIEDAHAAGTIEANAMCVATATPEGRPSARIVLLRGLDARGLVFFTSYFSRKGKQLARNGHAAAVFYWPEIERQVRIEGEAEQLPDDESDEYFNGRPRGHQIGAWASEQSEPVESRDLLIARMTDYAARFEGEDVPRPHSWGGYVIRPELVEFWRGRPDRMHDRIEYAREGAAWTVRRLQP